VGTATSPSFVSSRSKVQMVGQGERIRVGFILITGIDGTRYAVRQQAVTIIHDADECRDETMICQRGGLLPKATVEQMVAERLYNSPEAASCFFFFSAVTFSRLYFSMYSGSCSIPGARPSHRQARRRFVPRVPSSLNRRNFATRHHVVRVLR
jgi:hypothetical protein